MQPQAVTMGRGRTSALWACPFRPFFLATAGYAVIVMAFWLGAWYGGWPLPDTIAPMQWHSHEMLFGVVTAAVAGFLLTAMCNWTGARPLSGPALMALFGLWLAGRVAMWSAAWLPGWLVAVIDASFLLAVAIYAGRVIIGAGNTRNLILVAVVSLVALANLLFHAGVWGGMGMLAQRAELATIVGVTMLMVIVGGRITPAFTRNWLQREGRDPASVRSWRWIDHTAIAATAALFIMVLSGVAGKPTAIIALVAGAANAVRLIGWSGWLARRDPLMWILHAGYAWIPLGLVLMGLAPWFAVIVDTAWIHAVSAGAMGILIIGVMTRVSLGHTGRPLTLPRSVVPAYWLIILAAVVRVAAALGLVAHPPGIVIAGAAWISAFALFVVVYWPILSQPRADGRPG